MMIEIAKALAKEAHRGQLRKDQKTPYFEGHIEPVALSVDDYLKPIAYLHDILEDTAITLLDLQMMGFPDYVTRAVYLLTHQKGDSNYLYWIKLTTNCHAVEVKIADIKHNLSDNPSKESAAKYRMALTFFKERGFNVD